MSYPIDAFERVIVRLREKGFAVGGVPGWRTRDYKDRGLTPVAVIEHHTGSSRTSDQMLAIDGNGVVDGPLCNFTVYPDGKIVAIAAGYANHAGYNNREAFAELRDLAPMGSDIDPGPSSNDSATFSGNSRSVGIEVKSSGTFTAAQHASTAALEAALVIELGLSATRPPVGGHREITGRKIDPVHPMWERRREVAELVAAWTAPPRPTALPVDGVMGSATVEVYQYLEGLARSGAWDVATTTRLQEQLNARLASL